MPAIELNESIHVLVDFDPSTERTRTRVVPRAFRWKNRRYVITSLNLVHHEKQGEATVYYFSVSTETNVYKLSFNTVTLEWRLVEIWDE